MQKLSHDSIDLLDTLLADSIHPPVKDSTVSFLIAEFQAIQDRVTQIEQSKTSSINFYFVIVAAAVAGTPGLLNMFTATASVVSLISIVSLLLFTLGVMTLNNSVDQSVSIISLYRRAGRIRRWFVEHDPKMEEYVAFEASDDKPSIYVPVITFRGSETTLFAVNVITISLAVASISFLVSFLLSIVSIIVFLPLSWVLQERYIRKKLINYERRASRHVRIPSKSKGRKSAQTKQ